LKKKAEKEKQGRKGEKGYALKKRKRGQALQKVENQLKKERHKDLVVRRKTP